eukprot:3171633-Rhodomonas_salina.2
MHSIELAYGATRSRYRARVRCYDMRGTELGTELGYGATWGLSSVFRRRRSRSSLPRSTQPT